MPWTNVSLVLNSRDRVSGSRYNASRYNALGQNIIQGQIHSVSVNEINFPYDIPNIQAGPQYDGGSGGIYNTFQLESQGAAGVLTIVIPPGFYSGTELESAINTDIGIEAVAAGITAADAPTVSYDSVSNRYSFLAPVNAGPGNTNATWFVYSPYTYPPGTQQSNNIGKDILSIMGFSILQGVSAGQNFVSSEPGVNNRPVFAAAAAAPLVFTQYIDICSPLLCQYQFFRDGSTTNLARRSDVVCRLYVSNNVATQEEEGARPFVIHRQFNNARVMRWSAESAIGQLDINLFDDCGTPLTTTWEPRPFQITFNAYEQDKDSITY